jgi:hypothetical protein
MYDFIAAYFLFLPVYPLALLEHFNRAPLGSIVWLIITISVIFLLRRFKQATLLKVFIVIWVMPGTIVCGAAAIAPWPLTIPFIFIGGGCANSLSLSGTLAFNTVLVFGFSYIRAKKFSRNQGV